MKKQQAFQSIALRFKRWSRKRYAAFISIQRTVTIGQLSSSVSERFQTKNSSVHSSVLSSDHAGEEEITDAGKFSDERLRTEALSVFSQMLLLLFSLQTVKQVRQRIRSLIVLNSYILKREVSA